MDTRPDRVTRRRLTHVDRTGRPRMVDVSAKPQTARRATAEAFVALAPETLSLVIDGGERRADDVVRPDRHATRDDDGVDRIERHPQTRRHLGQVVAGDPQPDGFGPGVRDERRQARTVRVGDAGRPESLAGGSHLVARRQDRDARPTMDGDRVDARARSEGDRGRGQLCTSVEEEGSRDEVVAPAADRRPRLDDGVDEAAGGQRTGRLAPARATGPSGRVDRRRQFDGHDRVGAHRYGSAGRDPDRSAGSDGDRRRLAGGDLTDDAERDRCVLAGGHRIDRPDRVAVHRAVVPGRQVRCRPDRFGEHAPEAGRRVDDLDVQWPADGAEDGGLRFLDPQEAGRRHVPTGAASAGGTGPADGLAVAASFDATASARSDVRRRPA